jgi:hypothetical protein
MRLLVAALRPIEAAIRAESSAEIEAALEVARIAVGVCNDWMGDPDHGFILDRLALPVDAYNLARYAALAPADAAGRESYVTCGIDGCEFAVERGEGRTMALHQSEDHDPAYRTLTYEEAMQRQQHAADAAGREDEA